MTSNNPEKDNLLPAEAEGQDQSRVENTAVNQPTATEENGSEPTQDSHVPFVEKAEEPQETPTPESDPAENPGEMEMAVTQEETVDAAEDSPEVETENKPDEGPESGEPAEEKISEVVNNSPEKENQPENNPEENAEEKTAVPVQQLAKDYSELSADELVKEFGELLKEPIQHIGKQARSLREAFENILNADKEKEQENEQPVGENKPLADAKEHFDALWDEYRKKRENFAAQMAVEQKANLEERFALIEELKDLIEKEENASIKEFHNIQSRWRKCGMVPREQSSAVWQTYQHHVERFFDYLKLNREFRDMEFERNLGEKNKIIARAEELVGEPSIKKAFEELQLLHRLWKEETGPVAADQRDAVWERFSAATRAIHERRHNFLKEQKESLKANMEAKLAICQKIEAITAESASSHDGWQKKMAEVETLKNEFKATGPVPENKNSEIWERFKEVNRAFNQAKNNYYKELKRNQVTNLEKKLALVERAEELKDSTDWNATSSELKTLQKQWKEIGHVPRQKSDDLWKRFRAACNFFFENMSGQRKSGDVQSQANLKEKEQLLPEVEAFKISDDPQASIEALKALISRWRSIGKVPYSARVIEDKFNSLVDGYFEQLKVSRNDVAMIRFKDKVNQLLEDGNKQKFYAEMDFVRRKIDEITREVQQLRNNIEFFTSDSSDNPLVHEVNRSIERKSETLEQWKEKLAYMRQLKV